jgi:hypothetical protein
MAGRESRPSEDDPGPAPSDRVPDRLTIVGMATGVAGVLTGVVGLIEDLPGLVRLILVAVGTAVVLWLAIPTVKTALRRLLAAFGVVVMFATVIGRDAPSPSASLQVIGTPALLANRLNASNGYELVTPIRPAGLVNCWSGAKIDQQRWTTPNLFGRQLGTVAAVTVTQSDFAAPGNLEVIARYDDRLQLYWREFWQPPTKRWRGPLPVEVDGGPLTGASGTPALVQLRPGREGDFLLVSPREVGGLGVYHRDNSKPQPLPWSALKPLGEREPFTAVAMTRTGPNVIDLVAQAGHRLLAARFDHGQWTPLVQVATTTGPVALGRANLALTRSGRGLELVVPDENGGLAVYWRRGQAFGRLWQGPVRIGQSAGLFDGVAVAAASSSRRVDIVARQQQSLQHFVRPADGSPWSGPFSVTCDESRSALLSTEAP